MISSQYQYEPISVLDIHKKFAIHSCGHLALVQLAKEYQTEVYLVGTSNKCGQTFYKHTEPRSEITWLTGQEALLKVMTREGEEKRICGYNPVEDIIHLNFVDYMLTDIGCFKKENFDDFCNKIETCLTSKLQALRPK